MWSIETPAIRPQAQRRARRAKRLPRRPAFSAGAIFILRKRTKHLDNTGIYKMKLYPAMPVVFILAYLFVGTVIAITNPGYAITGTIVLAVFIVMYFIFHKKTISNV